MERHVQLSLFDLSPVDMAEDDLMVARGLLYKLTRKLKGIEATAVKLADHFHAKGWPGARVLDEASVAIGEARSLVAQLEAAYKMTGRGCHGQND